MSRIGNLEFEGESENLLRPDAEQLKGEEYYLAQARTAFANGDFEPALRMYSKVLEFNLQNSGAWSSQVRMLMPRRCPAATSSTPFSKGTKPLHRAACGSATICGRSSRT